MIFLMGLVLDTFGVPVGWLGIFNQVGWVIYLPAEASCFNARFV